MRDFETVQRIAQIDRMARNSSMSGPVNRVTGIGDRLRPGKPSRALPADWQFDIRKISIIVSINDM